MHITELQPQRVWKYFNAITKIPRPSKKEEKIIAYLLDFAKTRHLEANRDEFGNVLIRKPATKGMEDRKSVVLQSHSDMVCEKNADVQHDFNNDPITTKVEGDWVKAEGTTLGADDGIGIAASLAILDSDDIPHGPLEVLITADEETGMTGAFGLKPGFFESKTLINLDSEDEGELFIGCAGGIDTSAFFTYKRKKLPENSFARKISVTGLNGGHSGDEIDKGLGNAVKILNRILWNASNKFDLRIHNIKAGNLRNAIAREGFASTVIPKEKISDFNAFIKDISSDIKNEFAVTEKNLSIEVEDIDLPDFVIDEELQNRLLNSLYACWHGVYAFSASLDDMVETSTNLASVKFLEGNKIQVETSQRSSVDSAKYDMAYTVGAAFRLAGAEVKHGSGYPGWQPNPDSEIMKLTEKSYKKLFELQPEVKAIHAGLECGLFLEKYPGTDMISFGPTIKGAHSPDERISIETTQKFWDLLLDVLKNIPKK
jgi:dipeptidase D